MSPGASENGGRGGHSGSTSYDIHGLGQLVGFLATTDSQRQRGQGRALTDDGNGGEHAAGNAKDRSLAKLEKKGKAEEWYLEMKVCPRPAVVAVRGVSQPDPFPRAPPCAPAPPGVAP